MENEFLFPGLVRRRTRTKINGVGSGAYSYGMFLPPLSLRTKFYSVDE